MSTIPKLPKDPNAFSAWSTLKILDHMCAKFNFYKAVAEAQAELLRRYRNGALFDDNNVDYEYDQLQRDIEEARKL